MSKKYDARGVSALKEDVHEAIKKEGKGLFNNTFCKLTRFIASIPYS